MSWCVKEEPEWTDYCVSEEATRARRCAEHEVKRELVRSPEVPELQSPDSRAPKATCTNSPDTVKQEPSQCPEQCNTTDCANNGESSRSQTGVHVKDEAEGENTDTWLQRWAGLYADPEDKQELELGTKTQPSDLLAAIEMELNSADIESGQQELGGGVKGVSRVTNRKIKPPAIVKRLRINPSVVMVKRISQLRRVTDGQIPTAISSLITKLNSPLVVACQNHVLPQLPLVREGISKQSTINVISQTFITANSRPPVVIKPFSKWPLVTKPASVLSRATKLISRSPVFTNSILRSPMATKPISTSPLVTNPILASPMATKPISTSPIVTNPILPSPVATKPISTSPIVTSPILPSTVATKPISTSPIVTNPIFSSPGATKPISTSPIVTNPILKSPVAPKPTSTLPIVTNPILASPVATKPISTSPIVTNSILPSPVATKPISTSPIVTNPILPSPVATKPISTSPIVTNPILKSPVASKPTSTLPIVTNPILASPVATKPISTSPMVTKNILPSLNFTNISQRSLVNDQISQRFVATKFVSPSSPFATSRISQQYIIDALISQRSAATKHTSPPLVVTKHVSPLPLVTDISRSLEAVHPKFKHFVKPCSVLVERFELLMCAVCRVTFYLKTDLIEHISTHTTVQEDSNRMGQQTSSSINNRIQSNQKKIYCCNICKKSFFARHSLHLHEQRVHLLIKPFSCDTCSRKFSEKSGLKNHIRIHTGEKPFCCEICKTRYRNSSNLLSHRNNMHNNIVRPHRCPVCDKRFLQNYKLKSHMLAHCANKPYECTICKKQFVNNYRLKRHMWTHTGEKL